MNWGKLLRASYETLFVSAHFQHQSYTLSARAENFPTVLNVNQEGSLPEDRGQYLHPPNPNLVFHRPTQFKFWILKQVEKGMTMRKVQLRFELQRRSRPFRRLVIMSVPRVQMIAKTLDDIWFREQITSVSFSPCCCDYSLMITTEHGQRLRIRQPSNVNQQWRIFQCLNRECLNLAELLEALFRHDNVSLYSLHVSLEYYVFVMLRPYHLDLVLIVFALLMAVLDYRASVKDLWLPSHLWGEFVVAFCLSLLINISVSIKISPPNQNQTWEFCNPKFIRGCADLLHEIP